MDRRPAIRKPPKDDSTPAALPAEVAQLVSQREDARHSRQWDEADSLRQRIADMGFEVQDTPEGPRCRRKRERAKT
jgi:cysteinyl-tRNA synthetase